jgi:hypothetical protein
MLKLKNTDDPKSLRSRLTRAVLQMEEQREALEELFIEECQRIGKRLKAEVSRVSEVEGVMLWGLKGPLATTTNELQTIAGAIRQLDEDLALLKEVHRGVSKDNSH